MNFENSIVDGEKVIIDNVFKSAMLSIVEKKQNVFLTGKAGTGKTIFLKTLTQFLDKDTIVLAPTGIAALNSGGQTIHSFFHLPFKPLLPSDKIFRKVAPKTNNDKTTNQSIEPVTIYNSFKYSNNRLAMIKKMKTLIIDEVSMVRCDVLSAIDLILKVFRNNESEPFGGVQVVLIGDPFQLPPILKPNEQSILQKQFKGRFFFDSDSFISSSFRFFELKQVYRQHDKEFIEMLNSIREGALSENDISILKGREKLPIKEDGFMNITTTNYKVDFKNNSKLNKLTTKLYSFHGTIDGKYNTRDSIAEVELKLKKGSQVMFIKNLSGQYVNGTIGEVVELGDNHIRVKIDDNNFSIEINVEKRTFKSIEYFYDDKDASVKPKTIGTLYQYPLKLAWSLTVHKTQGLTFKKVIADLEGSFAYGQVYVALSRCEELKNLFLESKINRFKLAPHPRVVDFYKRSKFE